MGQTEAIEDDGIKTNCLSWLATGRGSQNTPDVTNRVGRDEIVAGPSYGIERDLGKLGSINFDVRIDSAADADDLKPDIFTLAITVSPNDQR